MKNLNSKLRIAFIYHKENPFLIGNYFDNTYYNFFIKAFKRNPKLTSTNFPTGDRFDCAELKDDFEEEFERQTEQIFKELEQRVSKKLKIEDNNYSNESGSFVYEFSISIGKDSKPEIKEFKYILEDLPSKEELIDILENEKEFKIILEMLKVKKSEIKIKVAENSIIIFTDNRKYFKKISMPKKIKRDLAKVTYNNGILEISVRKIEDYESIRK